MLITTIVLLATVALWILGMRLAKNFWRKINKEFTEENRETYELKTRCLFFSLMSRCFPPFGVAFALVYCWTYGWHWLRRRFFKRESALLNLLNK
jgi:hypothetical protein